MNLPKAILELDIPKDITLIRVTQEFLEACKLGRVALKRIKELREAGNYIGMPLLKGETEATTSSPCLPLGGITVEFPGKTED